MTTAQQETKKQTATQTANQSGKLFSVSLEGNPTVYVEARDETDAVQLYAKFFGIRQTDHQYEVTPADELPDGERPIFRDASGRVMRLNTDGLPEIAH